MILCLIKIEYKFIAQLLSFLHIAKEPTFQILLVFLYSNNYGTVKVCTQLKNVFLGFILIASFSNSQRSRQPNDLRQPFLYCLISTTSKRKFNFQIVQHDIIVGMAFISVMAFIKYQ